MIQRMLGATVLGSALLFVSCGSDETASPERIASVQRQQSREGAKAKQEKADSTTPAPAPARPIATAKAEKWPGVEARLMRVERSGNFLSTEVHLVNTGTAPVTVTDYSATGATIVDPESRTEYEVFTQAHAATVTEHLTATLEPGQQTSVFAVFPAPQSRRVTLKLPELPIFENVPVRRRGQSEPSTDSKATNAPPAPERKP